MEITVSFLVLLYFHQFFVVTNFLTSLDPPPDLNQMSRADYERYMFQRSQAQRNRSLTSSGPYQSGYQHDHHDDDDNETDIQTSTSRPNYNPYTQNTLQENQYQSSQPDDSYYDPRE